MKRAAKRSPDGRKIASRVVIGPQRASDRLAPAFYDCEASCVGGLPIEIGWAFAGLATGEIHSEGHLVKPPPNWDLGPVWDPDAEKLHKITREELYAHGRMPVEIADRMNRTLRGRELYSDHPLDDERWCFEIWKASGAPAFTTGDTGDICMIEPTFKLRQVNAENLIARLAVKRGWDTAGYEAAKGDAARIAPKKHRAEADARHLAVLWLMISRGPHGRG
jgi:hypothetical protein